MKSGNTNAKRQNNIQVLIEFRALTEALTDSLNNLGSAEDNFVVRLSKSIDDKIDKLISGQNSRQPENLNRDREDHGTSSMKDKQSWQVMLVKSE